MRKTRRTMLRAQPVLHNGCKEHPLLKTELCDTIELPNPAFAGWDRPRISERATEVLVQGLLRKEVIQPQVPLRLPCYDFTPIIDQTLGIGKPDGFRSN